MKPGTAACQDPSASSDPGCSQLDVPRSWCPASSTEGPWSLQEMLFPQTALTSPEEAGPAQLCCSRKKCLCSAGTRTADASPGVPPLPAEVHPKPELPGVLPDPRLPPTLRGTHWHPRGSIPLHGLVVTSSAGSCNYSPVGAQPGAAPPTPVPALLCLGGSRCSPHPQPKQTCPSPHP